ncbi:MAG: DsbA family oxidoreductase [Dehalococcoidia bacterium]|nr:DsbA family oxidoreductase [Dehalococcoidia bacterium]
MQQEFEVQVEWRPYELHPEIPPEGKPLEERSRLGFSRILAMAKEAGLEMSPPPRIANSRLALEATEFANAQGNGGAFHRAVFETYWRRGLNIGQQAVLLQLADEAGLDREALRQALQQGTYREVLERKLGEARKTGANGVPAFVFNDRYLVTGTHPYEVFRNFIAERLLKERDEPRSP